MSCIAGRFFTHPLSHLKGSPYCALYFSSNADADMTGDTGRWPRGWGLLLYTKEFPDYIKTWIFSERPLPVRRYPVNQTPMGFCCYLILYTPASPPAAPSL